MSCRYCITKEAERRLEDGYIMTVVESGPEIETMNQDSDEINFCLDNGILWATYNRGNDIVAMSGFIPNYCPMCGELLGIPHGLEKEISNG